MIFYRKTPTTQSNMEAWSNRIQVANTGAHSVWLLSPTGTVTRVKVSTSKMLKGLIWTTDEDELHEWYNFGLSVYDCDYLIHRDNDGRCIYMLWKSMDRSVDKNINIPASRILIEKHLIEPPGANPLNSLPSDHVVLHMTVNGEMESYPFDQLHSDWLMFFDKHTGDVCRDLAMNRYPTAKHALEDYKNTNTRSLLVLYLINKYIGGNFTCTPTRWDTVQRYMLGCAISLLFTDAWTAAIEIHRSVPLKW